MCNDLNGVDCPIAARRGTSSVRRIFGNLFAAAAPFLALLAVSLSPPQAAASEAVLFPVSPASADEAIKTQAARTALVANYMACGNELNFWLRVGKREAGEDISAFITGKMLWLMLNEPPAAPRNPGGGLGMWQGVPHLVPVQLVPRPSIACTGTYTHELEKNDGDGNPHFAESDWQSMASDGTSLNRDMLLAYSKCTPRESIDACRQRVGSQADRCQREQLTSIRTITRESSKFDKDGLALRDKNGNIRRFIKVEVTHNISRECMIRQINYAILQMEIEGQPGSSHLPCPKLKIQLGTPLEIGESVGEWDVSVRALTRIAFMNDNHKKKGRTSLLDAAADRHIKDDLLSIRGGEGLKSYSFFQCGNQEQSTGPSEETEADRETLPKAVSSVGDPFGWLLRRLLLILLLMGAVLTAGLILIPLGAGPVVAALAAASMFAGAVLIFGRFPETENHILMIETSRYLRNQIAIAELQERGENHSAISKDQRELKEFLLEKFQDILKNDFEEYNSRAYSRYSLFAIMNIAEFADDPKLSDAARVVMDYSFAKAALGSSQSRRYPPLRRKMEAIKKHYNPYDAGESKDFSSKLFEQVELSDHVVHYLLFYTGQAQQLTTTEGPDDNIRTIVSIPFASLPHMVIHASSTLTPDRTTPAKVALELAINKATPYDQAIKHDGVEAYSSGRGWHITAGGFQAPAKNFFIVNVRPFFHNDDRGAAWPTTLMLSSGRHTAMEDFLRIEGRRIIYDDVTETFDENLCVAKGFACGYNVRIPASLNECGRPIGQWTFFDTQACRAYAEKTVQNRVFIALNVSPNFAECENSNPCNFGFFEAYSAQAGESFDDFVKLVTDSNPGVPTVTSRDSAVTFTYSRTKPGAPRVTFFAGTCVSFPEFTDFPCPAKVGIFSANEKMIMNLAFVRGLAEGEVMTADGNGRVTLRHPSAPSTTLTLDLTDMNNPVRIENNPIRTEN